MSVFTHPWEFPLLHLANYDHNYSAPEKGVDWEVAPARVVDEAYAYCEALTSSHSRSFYISSSLMPPEKRRAVRALYAFCRVTDDIIDRPQGDDPRAALEQWRERALTFSPPLDDLVAVAWADVRLRFGVPHHYAEQLITGVARDLTQARYQTFDELARYSYGVASTVGLMSMHITGFSGPDAIPYAVKLGVALQVTNILRDVADDWRNGRLYLPLDDLATFGLSEADLDRGVVTDAWRSFMRFQIDRNRQLYDEAWPGIGLLAPEGRLAIGAAADLYRAILNDIEAHDYDVFSRRAYVGTGRKLLRLPGIWWQTRRLDPHSVYA